MTLSRTIGYMMQRHAFGQKKLAKASRAAGMTFVKGCPCADRNGQVWFLADADDNWVAWDRVANTFSPIGKHRWRLFHGVPIAWEEFPRTPPAS